MGIGSLQRLIRTSLEKLPSYIKNYPENDQILLTDFLNVLEYHEVDEYDNRMLFSEKVEAYIDRYYLKHEKYYDLPYLWFSTDYFNIAARILNAEGFHVSRFYRYIVKHIQGDTKNQGVFGLIKDITPLSDLKWEVLQYSCNKFIEPLTHDQLLILQTVYSLLPKAGVKNLVQERIKSAIAYQRRKKEQETVENIQRKKRRNPQELNRLFTLINAQWNILLYPSKFGLDRLYFYLQLNDSSQFSDIIELRDDTNSTLIASSVYRELNFNNYLGILLLPEEKTKSMEKYLKQCDDQRIIKLYEVKKVVDIQVTRSLKLYEPGEGERNITSKEKRKLIQNIKNKKEFNLNFPKHFSISPRNYSDWRYGGDRKHGTRDRFVKLYCKSIEYFTFNELLSKDPLKRKDFRFSDGDLELLNYLHDEQSVIQIDFDPIRLMRDFSIDEYWIGPIDIQEGCLMNLISWLPDSHVISTEKNKYIWTRLTPEIVQWLKNDLEWTVTPIVEQHGGKNVQYRWFDSELQEWISPTFLRDI